MYRAYLAENPYDFGIFVQLGHCLKEQGLLIEALEAYSSAYALNEYDSDILLQMGHLHKIMGHRDESTKLYRRSAELDGNSHALNELRALGESPRIADLPVAVRHSVHRTGVFSQTHRSALGLAKRSLRFIGRRRGSGRTSSADTLAAADLARDRRDWQEAATLYQAYLTERPDHFAIWVQLGHALKEAGRRTEAIEAYHQAHKLNAVDASDLFLNLGHVYKLIGDRDTAVDFYKRSRELHPNHNADVELAYVAATHTDAAEGGPIERRILALSTDAERRLFQTARFEGGPGPLISILTPVYNVEEQWLRLMVESVQRQTYTNWELILVDDGSPNSHVRDVMKDLASRDPRVIADYRPNNGGISAATNQALLQANGDYIALVDNDDMLTHDALSEMVNAIETHNNPDWLYSDEFKIDEGNRASQLFAKPDWSPLMLLNSMYTSHLTFYKTDLVRDLGGFRSEFDFSQDYDLALRMSERASSVVHVKKYLYGWRMIPGSGAQGDKPDARRTNIAALQDAANRRGWDAVAVALPTANRLVQKMPAATAKVSVIIPSDNAQNITASISSIMMTSTYKNLELIVVTNSKIISSLKSSVMGRSVKWVAYDKPFNFSDKCNVGAAAASGETLIFFNDDVRVRTPDWVEAALEYIGLPNVGVVGLKLLYDNDTIQHAGMVTGVRRFVGTAFHCLPADTHTYFGMAQFVREVSLICGALLAMPAKLYAELGGFDSVNTPIYHSDVDLCFRVREAGYSCVYSPHATLLHIGHASLADEDKKAAAAPKRRKDKSEIYCLRRFSQMLSYDPYFPNTMRDLAYHDSQEDFTLYPAPITELPAGARDVLILSHDLTSSGAPRVAFDMAKSLKEAGCFVVVVSPVDGPVRERLQAEGIIVIIDSVALSAPDWLQDFARNFDRIICNTVVTWKLASVMAGQEGVYLYAHETGLIGDMANSDEHFRHYLSTARNLLASSPKVAEALARHGAPSNVLEPGTVDLRDIPAPQSSRTNIVKIGVFGSFEPRKGQDIAANAFALLCPDLKSKAELHFFGRSHDPHFESEVRKLWGNEPHIVFNGEVPHATYIEKIHAMDIIVVPSRDEPFSLVGIDALALGKTFICSSETGLSYYLDDGVSGHILKNNSAEQLHRILDSFLRNPGTISSVNPNARRVFEANFTMAAFHARLERAVAIFSDDAEGDVLVPAGAAF